MAEWGAHNWGSDGKDKYAALRTLYTEWAKRDGQPLPPAEPAPRPIEALGEVKFTHVLPLLSGASRDHFCPAGVPGRRVSGLPQPVAMEHPLLNQSQGIAVYEAELPLTAGSSQQLQFGSTEPRDYAVVSVGSDTQGTVFRTGNKPIPVSWPAASSGNNPSVLTIVMENMGHINYGHGMFDLKGLLSVPTIGGSSNATAANWSVCSMPMSGDDVAKAEPLFQPVSQGPPTGVPQLPAFLMGEFQAKASPATGKPPSTFLSVSGWGKGVAWVNGFALGRHWVSRGPQNALYVPESVLVEGTNSLVLLEEEALPVSAASGNNGRLGNNYEGLSVQLTDAPDFHGPSACNPLASAPVDGSNVVMYECRADLAKHQQWSLSAGGKLQVGDGSLGLCASAGPGKDPDGQPSVELSKCSGGSTQPEDWSYDSGSQALKVSPGGACMDITAHLSNNGANVETYSCNGGSNQQWSQPPAAGSPGTITSKQDGHCLTVCPPQSASE